MKYGEFENVEMTAAQVEKLVARFGTKDTHRRIEKLSTYLAAKGRRYKSHYAVILMWANRDAAGKPTDPGGARATFRLSDEELKAQREKEHARMLAKAAKA